MRRPEHEDQGADAGAAAVESRDPFNYEQARDALMNLLGKSGDPAAKKIQDAIKTEVLTLKPGTPA